MSVELLSELEAFVQFTDAVSFSRNLRHMMIVFMQTEVAKESFYTDDVLAGLERVLNLLDAISDEQKGKMLPKSKIEILESTLVNSNKHEIQR